MNAQILIDTARAPVAGDKALLVAESNPNCNKPICPGRGFPRSEEARRAYPYHRARCNRAARRGEYNAELEKT
jgi:hypothetical protein